MKKFFKLSDYNTSISIEAMAGLTTFFSMSYILFVNPAILSLTGMPSQAVFLATIIASAISTLVMGLFANVPYALAPGMGLNAFFTFTVCFGLGFSWQEALAMVFLCGILNILITITKIRKMLIHAIPSSLQHAIGAGIGVFITYIGVKNANFLNFSSSTSAITSINHQAFLPTQTTFSDGISSITSNGNILPELVRFTEPSSLLALFGLIFTIILLYRNIRGSILIGIITTTLIGIACGIVDLSPLQQNNDITTAFSSLSVTFGAAFGSDGLGKLFSDSSRLPLVLMTIFAFSLSDVFDTIGTFIGTGRQTGIFSKADEESIENSSGFHSKMDKALFADSIGTVIGSIFGTSNTTTYVESATGIGAGGRTGLTSVVVSALFLISSLFAPFISIIPAAATAPALIIVGVLMLSSFTDINWRNFEEAIPCFFASIFMAFAFSISYGIAAGFIFYVITKCATGKIKTIHPLIWIISGLFLINFIILAFIVH